MEIAAADEMYRCPCGKQFKRRVPYDRHMDVAHSNAQSHKCKVCGKTFGNLNTLTMHQSVHDSVKPSGNFGEQNDPKTKTSNQTAIVTKRTDTTRDTKTPVAFTRVTRYNGLTDKCSGVVSTAGQDDGSLSAVVDRDAVLDNGCSVLSHPEDDLSLPLPVLMCGVPYQSDTKQTIDRKPLLADCSGLYAQAEAQAERDARATPTLSRPHTPVLPNDNGLANTQLYQDSVMDILDIKLENDTTHRLASNSHPTEKVCSPIPAENRPTTVIIVKQEQKRTEPKSPTTVSVTLPSAHTPVSLQNTTSSNQKITPNLHTLTPVISGHVIRPSDNIVGEPKCGNGHVAGLSLNEHMMRRGINSNGGQRLSSASDDSLCSPLSAGHESSSSGLSDIENKMLPSNELCEMSSQYDIDLTLAKGDPNLRKIDRVKLKGTPGWKWSLDEQQLARLQTVEMSYVNGSRKRKLDMHQDESDSDELEAENALKALNDMPLDSDLDMAEELLLSGEDQKPKSNKTDLFTCNVCGKSFFSEKYLSMHSALHGAINPTETLLCDSFKEQQEAEAIAKRGGVIPNASWTCKICNKTFAQNSNFKNHMRTHSDERPFVCDICSIGFKERYHLKKHQLFKHSTELKEKCRVCGKRFKDSTAVRAHERIHSDVRPYSCRRCGKAFKTSECLWHHENRSKTCGAAIGSPVPAGNQRTKRGRPSAKKDKLMAQQVSHTLPILKVEPVMKVEPERTLLPCQSDNLISPSDAMFHKKVVIKTEPPLDPELAALAEDSLGDLDPAVVFAGISEALMMPSLPKSLHSNNLIHVSEGHALQNKSHPVVSRLTHAQLPVVVEDVMDVDDDELELEAARAVEGLKSPIMVKVEPVLQLPSRTIHQSHPVRQQPTLHAPQIQMVSPADYHNKKLECSKCAKNFTSSQAFERHLLTHSEARPYRCDICDLGFKLKVHLKKHNLYRHSDEYPCECNICGKRFKDSSAVHLHERIHSDSRPFSCSCGKTFKTKENLWGHQHRGPCETMKPEDGPMNATAQVGNGHMKAEACIRNNQIIAHAIVSNNKVTAQATIGDNGEVTASASITHTNGRAHASVDTSNGTAHATVSHRGTETVTVSSPSRETRLVQVPVCGTSTEGVVQHVAASTLNTVNMSAVSRNNHVITSFNPATSSIVYRDERKQLIQFVDVTPSSRSEEKINSSLPPFESLMPSIKPAPSRPTLATLIPAPSPTPSPLVLPTGQISPAKPARRPLSIAERCPTIQKCLQKGPQPIRLPGIHNLLQFKNGAGQGGLSAYQPASTSAGSPLYPTSPLPASTPVTPTDQSFLTNANPMLSSREPYRGTPPPPYSKINDSHYTDFSHSALTTSAQYPYGGTISRTTSISSDLLDTRTVSTTETSMPIIYWDEDSDKKTDSSQWHSDSDSLFQEISTAVFSQL